jgi:hypothetical protein
MPISISDGSLTGAEADQLRAVLAGREDFISARLYINGRFLTFTLVAEGYDPAAPVEPKPEPESYDHSKRIKPGWPGGV